MRLQLFRQTWLSFEKNLQSFLSYLHGLALFSSLRLLKPMFADFKLRLLEPYEKFQRFFCSLFPIFIQLDIVSLDMFCLCQWDMIYL